MQVQRTASSLLRHTTTSSIRPASSTLRTTLPIRHLSQSRSRRADTPSSNSPSSSPPPSQTSTQPPNPTNRTPASHPQTTTSPPKFDTSTLFANLDRSSLDFARGSRPRAKKPIPADLQSLLRETRARSSPPSSSSSSQDQSQDATTEGGQAQSTEESLASTLSSYNATRPPSSQATLSQSPINLSDLSFYNAAKPRSSPFGAATVSTIDPLAPSPVPLDTTVGRTITVNYAKGVYLFDAFKKLDVAVGRNLVRRQHRQQKEHERPGIKRKRLASQRWRRRFKAGFDGICQRVVELRKQGW